MCYLLQIKGHTRIVGKGGLYSRTSFIYKYETLHGFILKGVSGGWMFCTYK